MNGYSLDLRERVLALVDVGTARTEIGQTLRVSLASIGRYVRLRREGQSLATGPAGAHRPGAGRSSGVAASGRGHRGQPGAALRVVGANLGGASKWTNHEPRPSQGGGLDTKKKTQRASEQDPIAWAAWRAMAREELHGQELVFVDESGANRALGTLYGWAPRGQRALGQLPRNRGRNTSILAAMSARGLVASMTVEGSTNKEVFLLYLKEVLRPALRPGQVVVMDNLSVP